MRGPKKKGVRYFGPYAHAWAIRETLDLLLRVFPARTCSAGVFKRAGQIGRPCLLGYIGKCSAPCVGRVSAEEHRQIVDDFCDFMAGKTDTMMRAARARDAAGVRGAGVREGGAAPRRPRRAPAGDGEAGRRPRRRHRRRRRRRSPRTSWRPRSRSSTCAAAGCAASAAGSWRRSRRSPPASWWSSSACRSTADETGGEASVPREVLVPELPDGRRRRSPTAGGAARGEGVAAGAAARRQARRSWRPCSATRSRRSPSTGSSAPATSPRASPGARRDAGGPRLWPRRRCASSATTSRTSRAPTSSASMVVFEDGLARKSDYRRFSVAARRHRRHRRHRRGGAPPVQPLPRRARGDGRARRVQCGQARHRPETGRPRRFAYPPNLVVVDGGAPQVAAAARSLDELGIDDVAVCGLAKRMEEVWLPGDDPARSCRAPREGLYLLQRVRDEAHRFAITYHRQKRSKSMTGVRAGRRPGPRGDAAEGADAAVRVAQAAAGGHGRGDRRRCPASGGGRPRRSSARDSAGTGETQDGQRGLREGARRQRRGVVSVVRADPAQ